MKAGAVQLSSLREGFLDSRLVRAVTLIINLVILSIVVMVCSLPVVTLLPACTAGFGVVRDWTRLGETAVLRPFLHHLRDNFVPALLLEAPAAALAVLFWLDVQLVPHIQPSALRLPVLIVTMAFGLVVTAVGSVTLPVLVHYDVTLRAALRNAAAVALGHPTTGLGCAAIVVIGTLCAWIAPPVLIITLGTSIYSIHLLCARAFAADDRRPISDG